MTEYITPFEWHLMRSLEKAGFPLGPRTYLDRQEAAKVAYADDGDPEVLSGMRNVIETHVKGNYHTVKNKDELSPQELGIKLLRDYPVDLVERDSPSRESSRGVFVSYAVNFSASDMPELLRQENWTEAINRDLANGRQYMENVLALYQGKISIVSFPGPNKFLREIDMKGDDDFVSQFQDIKDGIPDPEEVAVRFAQFVEGLKS